MTEYKRLNEKIWNDFGKDLLVEKGSEKQKKFLQICQSGKNSFLKYIDENLTSIESAIIDGDTVPFQHKFTEREFLYPPTDTQESIWNTFKNTPREMMSCCGFWGYTIINMIKGNGIQPDYLAAELNGDTKTGMYVIDAAQKSKSDTEKSIDDCVRRILRSMCNPNPRGKRIVFDDFYLGKSYWCWHWANKMFKHNNTVRNFRRILKVFSESYYATFAGKMHSNKSYIGSENVLGGLLLYLIQARERKITITNKQLGKIIDKIGYLSAWKAIEIQDPILNQREIEIIAENL